MLGMASALVLILFLGFSWAVFHFGGLSLSGDLGVAFAASGALFSALAFAGLIVALLLQRQELALQRTELAMTREELAGQKSQLEAQTRTMSRDVFESCFFQLVALNRRCVTDFTAIFPGSHQQVSGLTAFRHAAAALTENMHFEFSPPLTTETKAALLAQDFTEHCLAAPSDFSHYFRNLYHVFAFIDRSEQSDEAKEAYARIVRAQMSNAELILLFANSQAPAGRGFVDLIERYALFKVLQWPDHMRKYSDLYRPEAYGLNKVDDVSA